ncbi:gamma-glutamylcyclotransferase [Clostridia bacterium]|nr:gamma-glutamylcyclotransferase [Clostridia bacterium]
MSKAKRRLYVAYGSNMNLEQMALRCPTAKVVGTAVMRNWRLIFQGVASIERHKGGEAPVLVWEIQPEDEIALDRYEGYPRMYRKKSVRVRINGKQVRAMVYVMNGARRLYPPTSGYYNTIRNGYIAAGQDLNVLREAAEMSKKWRKQL